MDVAVPNLTNRTVAMKKAAKETIDSGLRRHVPVNPPCLVIYTLQ